MTDARFPAIWDANYARLDADLTGLTLDELERELFPALLAVGAEVEHVLAFDADAARGVLAQLSSRGHRLSWDLVMAIDDVPVSPERTIEVVEADLDEATWRSIRASLSDSFGIERGAPLEQLMRLEREVLAPNGKRWFGLRIDDRLVSVAALLELHGTAYVDNVATEPKFRGRGFASSVTAHVVRTALGDGARTVFLLTDPAEAATVRMYERLGFGGVSRLASTRGPVAG